jgi:hypothetical protein
LNITQKLIRKFPVLNDLIAYQKPRFGLLTFVIYTWVRETMNMDGGSSSQPPAPQSIYIASSHLSTPITNQECREGERELE